MKNTFVRIYTHVYVVGFSMLDIYVCISLNKFRDCLDTKSLFLKCNSYV